VGTSACRWLPSTRYIDERSDDDRTSHTEPWPYLPVDQWTETRNTLHMWAQIVGKIRLANAPMVNHWWQVPLYVSARGSSTSAIPHGSELFDIEFDFVDHKLHMRSSTGGQQWIDLEPKTVATFYSETMAALDALGSNVTISASPVELERALPFAEDWGAMDLACTRFSGRTAPHHPGGAPNCGDWVMVEGYSHDTPVRPEGAYYDTTIQEFLLPYEAVRTADDPEATLLDFLQTTYAAAADNAAWDREELEDEPDRRASAR